MILPFLIATMTPNLPAPSLKVMTYNIRFGTANDGPNAWPHRRAALLRLVQRHNPDVLGVQEALASQIDELRVALPEHDVVGVGRDDGVQKGEYAATFYRRTKLGLREGGTRWISDTPLVPGSKGPGANLPRVYSWLALTPVEGPAFLVLNAHFDHQSEPARVLGAVQMRAFAASRPELPALLMGDFNCSFGSAPLNEFLKGDVFTAAKPAQGPFGTFNAFDPKEINGDMIDHILFDRRWKLNSVEIDRTLDGTRTPSDHFPVIATLTLGGP